MSRKSSASRRRRLRVILKTKFRQDRRYWKKAL